MMDISNISNVYDDLRAVESLSRPKVPIRSTSTIGYISPREVENPHGKQSTVSLILPASSKEIRKLETILSIDDSKQSSSIGLIEEKDQSCICWAIHTIIQLLCIALFACFIAMFIFTLIFYAFDVYWFEPFITNHSFWWFNNNTEYEMFSTTQTIDYDNEY